MSVEMQLTSLALLNMVSSLVEGCALPAFNMQGVAGYRFPREQIEALIKPSVTNSEKKRKHTTKA